MDFDTLIKIFTACIRRKKKKNEHLNGINEK